LKRIASLIFALGVAVLAFQGTLPKPVQAVTTTWDVRLVGIKENPPILDDAAWATARFTFDDTTRTLTYFIDVFGVAPELVIAAHIHQIGAVGVNTNPKYPLLEKGTTHASGKVTIDASDLPALLGGDMYVNLHTVDHPNGAARAQIESPIKTVYRMEINARNKGDISALMLLFADNAQQIGGGLCAPPTPCLTLDAIRRQAENTAAAHQEIRTVGLLVSGNTLSAREEHRTDTTRAAGIDRQINIDTETIQGGKIIRKLNMQDVTDPQTVAFAALQAARSQATPAAIVVPPATGDGGLASIKRDNRVGLVAFGFGLMAIASMAVGVGRRIARCS
jgi:hypothetical protein